MYRDAMYINAVLGIASDLYRTELSIKDIARKHNVKKSFVYDVNKGKTQKIRLTLWGIYKSYPLRIAGEYKNNLIRIDLFNGYKISDIAEWHNTTEKHILDIIYRDRKKEREQAKFDKK